MTYNVFGGTLNPTLPLLYNLGSYCCICGSLSVCDSLSLCVSACLHDKTKTAKTKTTRLGTWDSPSRVLAHILVLHQKVEVTGSQSAKVIDWPALVMHSRSAQH